MILVDIYSELEHANGDTPPFTKEQVFAFEAQGYKVKWDDFGGYSFAWLVFETDEEAVTFKLRHW